MASRSVQVTPGSSLKAQSEAYGDAASISGPIPALNPTRARFGVASAPQSNIIYSWSSRNNRKGRHEIQLSKNQKHDIHRPDPSSSSRTIARTVWRMLTYFPVWDISYLIAVIFTLGSVIWVCNAFFAFLPLLQPGSEFDGEILYGGGISAFVGATIFEIGSILLMMEASNENRTECFGWAVEQVLTSDVEQPDDCIHEVKEAGIGVQKPAVKPDPSSCRHHQMRRSSFLPSSYTVQESSKSAKKQSAAPIEKGRRSEPASWVWIPGWSEIRSHYMYELGWLACFFQLVGATVFWISGFTALPGIYNKMSDNLVQGVYWTPQVVGGCGFVISGTLFMIETQRRWYEPALQSLGWHVGLWNLIGGVGFTICPVFGYYDAHSWGAYQASCSTFWGSWAFLIGSLIQWYESMSKYPVEYVPIGHNC